MNQAETLSKTPKPKVVIYTTGNFMQSVMSDFFTLGFLAFNIWLSSDSTFWTLVTGCLFMVFLFGTTQEFTETNMFKFYTKKQLLEWANSLPEDEK